MEIFLPAHYTDFQLTSLDWLINATNAGSVIVSGGWEPVEIRKVLPEDEVELHPCCFLGNSEASIRQSAFSGPVKPHFLRPNHPDLSPLGLFANGQYVFTNGVIVLDWVLQPVPRLSSLRVTVCHPDFPPNTGEPELSLTQLVERCDRDLVTA